MRFLSFILSPTLNISQKIMHSIKTKYYEYFIIGDNMFNLNDVYYVASILNITFDKFTPEEFLTGINIELEHGKVNWQTNVSNDDLLTTAKIALAHLNEYPNYYNPVYGLNSFEKFLQSKLK